MELTGIMRRRSTVTVGIVFLGLLALLLLGSTGVLGWNLVAEEDFTGIDGMPLDSDEWEVHLKDPSNSITYDSNRVKLRDVTSDWPWAMSKWNFSANNFTFLVDWYPDTGSGGPLVVGAYTNESGTRRAIGTACYSPGWGWHAYRYPAGGKEFTISNINTLQTDMWYTVNMTFRDDKFNITITRKDNGAVKWSVTNLQTSPFAGKNYIYLSGVGATLFYDNLRIYDLDRPPNVAPLWRPVPTIQADEDVPLNYDFSPFIIDPDDPLDQLSLSSASPFFFNSVNLQATFIFPDGISNATVPIVVRDRWGQAVMDVNFTVQPVNDPPSHNIPQSQIATEDEPLTLDLYAYVWDMDNPREDLSIVTTDAFATVEGFNLTVTFLEGIASHDLFLNVTDGLLSTEAHIYFGVRAVDDPPIVGALDKFSAVEGQVSVFNITQYLSDIDTPIEALRLMSRDPNCTVHGQELHILFHVGEETHYVDLEITDASNRVSTMLEVYVEPVNDAPVLAGISPKLFTEDEAATVELAIYISDEDNYLSEISLICDHPAVTVISEHNITFLYTSWQPGHTIHLQVFDGMAYANGSFEVQIKSVNDAPSILGIGNLTPPISIVLEEGSERWFVVRVADEDNSAFDYTLESLWNGVSVFANGSLRVSGGPMDVGEFDATITVDDRNGGTANLVFSIEVMNVNDSPSNPIIVKPPNHTVIEEGDNITFAVDVSDPDMIHGQVLTVNWVSNISGLIRVLTTEVELTFTRNQLPLGDHSIAVTVSDGEFIVSEWVAVLVVEKYVPPPPKPDEPSFLAEPTGIAAVIGLAILVLVVVAFFVTTKGKRADDDETEDIIPAPEATPLTIEVTDAHDQGLSSLIPAQKRVVDDGKREGEADLGALSQELDRLATDLEAQRASEWAEAPPAAELETVSVPEIAVAAEVSAEERADRAHATDVREVMKTLTQLPRGMPTALWGKDLSLLAKEIAYGTKRTTADGTEIVEVDGHWYTSDHTRIGTFLQEWKEEDASDSSTTSEDKRAKKLDQLEERLLEGKISEETYNKLTKKYSQP